MQAINNVMQSNAYAINGGQISIHHGSKQRFGPLEPTADAPPEHFQNTWRTRSLKH
jgi:hypothetical protein